jgi:hypothetical protein
VRFRRELGGFPWSAPGTGGPRRFLEEPSHVLVGLGGSPREMMRTLFLVRRDLGEARVERASPRGRQPCGDCRSEQRVCETHALVVQLDDPRSEGFGEARTRLATHRSFHEGDGGVCEESDGRGDLERGRGELVEPVLQQLAERSRDRECLTEGERPAAPLEGAAKLEGEERVPCRCLPKPEERRSGEHRPQAIAEQLVGCADAQPPDLDLPRAGVGQAAAKPLWRRPPHGQQK